MLSFSSFYAETMPCKEQSNSWYPKQRSLGRFQMIDYARLRLHANCLEQN